MLVIVGILAFHLLGSQPETLAIWTTYIPHKIYFDPIQVAGKTIILAGDKGKRTYIMYELNEKGSITAESVKMPVFPYPPLKFDNIVVLADRTNMVRGFSVPGLKIEWEAGFEHPIPFSPEKIKGGNFLVPSGKNAIFVLNGKTGQQVWDYQFSKSLVNYGADDVVVCISGYNDLQEPSWTLTGHSIEDGELLWTLDEPVSSDKPLFIQGLCITTNARGNLIIVKQKTGEVIFRHEIDGLKAVQLLGDSVILLGVGGSRIVCFSLMTGNSWTITMNSAYVGSAKFSNRLLLVNKKSVRCVDSNNGSLFWNRNFGDIYNAFPFRQGIFITHKDSFFDRTTYGTYVNPRTGNPIWTTYGKSIMQKPLVTGYGDLVAAYNGTVKLLPAPASIIQDSIQDIPQSGKNIADTTAKFWENSIATSSAYPASSSNGQKKTDPAAKTDPGQIGSDYDLKGTGWVTDQ